MNRISDFKDFEDIESDEELDEPFSRNVDELSCAEQAYEESKNPFAVSSSVDDKFEESEESLENEDNRDIDRSSK